MKNDREGRVSKICLKGEGGGFRPPNFRNMISSKWLAQKVHPVGQLFGWVLRPQTHMGMRGATPIFGPMQGPKNPKWHIRPKTWISYDQSIGR